MESSTTTVPTITLKPLLDERRTIANKRERERVHSLRSAFHGLGEVVPKDDAEPQLTRIDVVRRAKDYIAYLANLLESNVEDNSSVFFDSDAESSASGESTSVKSDDIRTSFLDWRVDCNELMRLPEKRVKCNERARTRSRQTKQAFASLKDLIPIHPAEAELSRIEVLRRATEYIAFMATLLGDSELQTTALASSEVSSTPDNVSVDCISDLLCSPDTGASFSTTASPSGSLALDLANVGIASYSPPDFDSDYASMSPPSSAASDCSFTFPSIACSTTSPSSAMSTAADTECYTTTTCTRPHSSLARSSSHPYAPCSPRPRTRHVQNAAAPAVDTCFSSRGHLRAQRRSFSDSDIADLDLESLLSDQTSYALSSCTDNLPGSWTTFVDPLAVA